MIDEEATGANGARETRCCGWEADAGCGGVSLAVPAGGPAPLEAPARTWDMLVDAGCSSDEPLGAIASAQKKRDDRHVDYGMGVGVLLYLKQNK